MSDLKWAGFALGAAAAACGAIGAALASPAVTQRQFDRLLAFHAEATAVPQDRIAAAVTAASPPVPAAPMSTSPTAVAD